MARVVSRLACLALLPAALLLHRPREARAQGCIVARPTAPLAGSSGSPYLEAGHWQLSLAYRWSRSERHFSGTDEQEDRERDGSANINDASNFNLELAYAIDRRFSLAAILPYQVAERSEPIWGGKQVVARNRTSARGIGDVALMARGWLLDPARYLEQNVALGVGLKVPTGQTNATDSFRSATGPITVRTVDASIQPGDGGFGLFLSLQAFYKISRATLYLSGTYLLNPREANGVNTYLPLASSAFMSVPDSYLARAGSYVQVYKGLAAGLGGRIEGTPVEDALGKSGGFRRPGYVLSAEPGVAFASGPWALSASVPIALVRDRPQSVPERQDNVPGDAAFADYTIVLGVSYRAFFGKNEEATITPPPEAPARAIGQGPGRELGQLGVKLWATDGAAIPPQTLSAALGSKLTVVHLWATWCAPCKEEIPVFNAARASYADRGVSFVAISVDDDPHWREDAHAFPPMEYPGFWGGTDAGTSLSVSRIPTTLVLDANGKIVDRVVGSVTQAELERKLDELLVSR